MAPLPEESACECGHPDLAHGMAPSKCGQCECARYLPRDPKRLRTMLLAALEQVVELEADVKNYLSVIDSIQGVVRTKDKLYRELDGKRPASPIPMRLPCPACGELHVDAGEFATKIHHTHACQACGMVWRPAVVATVGVYFLPGFKNEDK